MKILLAEKIHEAGMTILEQAGKVMVSPSVSEEVIVEELKDADAFVVRSSPVTRRMIQASPRLKVIGRHGIGVDNIDLEAATERGVIVVNTPDANSMSVAEYVVMAMGYLAKRFKEADRALREGLFNRDGSLPGLVTRLGFTCIELNGKTLGLVGFGRIGRLVARKCRDGFDMRVIAYDPYISEEAIRQGGAVPRSDLESVFVEADVVSVHVPLSEETRGLIDMRYLRLMKPTAYLINAARGGIVVEKDLYEILKEKRIAGAAIDVFEKEPPPPDHPFFTLDNVLVTPHMAAMTDGALKRMAEEVARDVVAVLKGERPRNLVNPQAWDETRFKENRL
ncbi:hydroxyacid dehydrogenase [Thermodesulforhabdus norvegica]|uniref:D-3-phosphoglycerate dehydrogenase n=1 Tax=Thermodesulforhabdus norvegica TaxID=39841 RepID=A0A1I4R2H6_9BACT|nr:hydroxyacid dehydrogenase [Thermodesulforhabdus norvegica]SFM46469.1 D-3-phosphoglycerate dehydrogenase [Thermodesulforhabdus norvegica]